MFSVGGGGQPLAKLNILRARRVKLHPDHGITPKVGLSYCLSVCAIHQAASSLQRSDLK